MTSLFFIFKMNKGEEKKSLLIGAIILILVKLVEIPMQEYQLVSGTTLNNGFWAIISILNILGFLFLLFGFKREIK